MPTLIPISLSHTHKHTLAHTHAHAHAHAHLLSCPCKAQAQTHMALSAIKPTYAHTRTHTHMCTKSVCARHSRYVKGGLKQTNSAVSSLDISKILKLFSLFVFLYYLITWHSWFYKLKCAFDKTVFFCYDDRSRRWVQFRKLLFCSFYEMATTLISNVT